MGSSGLGQGSAKSSLTDRQQAALTACMLIQLFKVVYMLRLTTWGQRVATIPGTFCSGAITEMWVLTMLFFSGVLDVVGDSMQVACLEMECVSLLPECD